MLLKNTNMFVIDKQYIAKVAGVEHTATSD